MSGLLDNYKQLTTRIDALCSVITEALGEQISCSPGCSSCCTSITVFPVEAAAMREAVESLPEFQAEEVYRHVSGHADGERCPLLFNHHCLLYKAHPIICRSHGLPIIYTNEGELSSDCCPLNQIETETISGSSVIDIDKLNTLLAAVNSIYLSQIDSTAAMRVTIADALAKKQAI
jgi:Fe-S-cluster containining protein